MKKLYLLAISLIIMIIIYSQEINQNFDYSDIVSIEDTTISKEQLYLIIIEWFNGNFKSSKHVIQFEDKEEGVIIGKGNIPIKKTMYLTDSRVEFTIKILIKDSKYRYRIMNFSHISNYDIKKYSGGNLNDSKPDCGYFLMTKKGWKQVKEQTNIEINLLIISLKETINQAIIEDNW
jgi:hypothetical protein